MTPPGEIIPLATCGPHGQLASTAFAGDAVWVLVAPDASTSLALRITVRKTDASYPGELSFAISESVYGLSIGTDANGNTVLTLRPYVSGSTAGAPFEGVCDGRNQGIGGLSVAWSEAPVAGRHETVTFQ